MGLTVDREIDVKWTRGSDLLLTGIGWSADSRQNRYSRLPDLFQGIVADKIWHYGCYSSGLAVCLETNSQELIIECVLTKQWLDLSNMSVTAASGLDIYNISGGNSYCWIGSFSPRNAQERYRVSLKSHGATSRLMVYLPLYNGVGKLNFGLSSKNYLAPYNPFRGRPLVFYGSSITQGGCVSRAGLAYPSILGRLLNRPSINLGFSGCATLEKVMASKLAEIEASVYVIEAVSNLSEEQVTAGYVDFVTRLKELRPSTPLVVIEDFLRADVWFYSEKRNRQMAKHCALRRLHASLPPKIRKGIHYIKTNGFLQQDQDIYADSAHPNDLGTLIFATKLESIIKGILEKGLCARAAKAYAYEYED